MNTSALNQFLHNVHSLNEVEYGMMRLFKQQKKHNHTFEFQNLMSNIDENINFGMKIKLIGKSFVVTETINKSMARRLGVPINAEIQKIDGKLASHYTLQELEKLFETLQTTNGPEVVIRIEMAVPPMVPPLNVEGVDNDVALVLGKHALIEPSTIDHYSTKHIKDREQEIYGYRMFHWLNNKIMTLNQLQKYRQTLASAITSSLTHNHKLIFDKSVKTIVLDIQNGEQTIEPYDNNPIQLAIKLDKYLNRVQELMRRYDIYWHSLPPEAKSHFEKLRRPYAHLLS